MCIAVREHANMHTGCDCGGSTYPLQQEKGNSNTHDHFHTSQADRAHAHLLCSMWPQVEERLHRISE